MALHLTETHTDISFQLLAATSLKERLASVEREMEGVRNQSEDIEYVHRMRVATRRLRAAMAVFQPALPAKDYANWFKSVKRITKRLGAARDADVQLEFITTELKEVPDAKYQRGIERLILRLNQRREALQPSVVKALDRTIKSKVLQAFGLCVRRMHVDARLHHAELLSLTNFRRGYEAIALALEEMLAFEPYIKQEDRVEELHQMRIAAKQLRYSIEIFQPLYGDEIKPFLTAGKHVQKLLGEIHDFDVWTEYLPAFDADETARTVAYFGHARPMARLSPGLQYLKDDCARRRKETYVAFVAYWKELKGQDIWLQLRTLLQQHVEHHAQGQTEPDA